ncbi:MAG: glycosyltransferase family 39 protein [Nanoarchaeota archaeon]|nr:glycosyltransferase family 39 protein [Nanoarchaeota archaeon]
MESISFLDKAIDKIFSIKKSTFYLILILLLGFVLRLIAAVNLTVGGDDTHFVTHAIDFFSEGRLITYDQSSGLWFAFTSIMYEVLGTTQLASRMAALIFGSISILVIYLLSREFFDERASLSSAFLLAIAPFHIKNTIAEMDVMTMFFVLLGMLLFIKALKNDKSIFYMISGVFFGLAIYTKVYPLLFIPSMLLFYVYWMKREKKVIFSKNNFKNISLFLAAAFIFTIPALTHNFLLYQDKGFLDLQFTRSLGLGKNISEQFYGWDHQFNAKNDWKGLIFGNSQHSSAKKPTIISSFEFILKGDPVIFLLGWGGIILITVYRKNYRPYVLLFLTSIFFALPFLASIILLPKHYIFMEVLLAPLAGFIVSEISHKISKRNSIQIIFASLFIFSLFYLGTTPQQSLGAHHFYGKSHMAQFMDFKDDKIPQNALIIADSRIYRGRINWPLQGRPYLEGTDFLNLLSKKDEIPGKEITVDIYFIECIKDDCGWGTIKDQPELNATMESLVNLFKINGQLMETISEPYEEEAYFPVLKNRKEDILNVYRGSMTLKDSIILLASQPKNWFLYDIGYKPIERQFDYYHAQGFYNNALDKLAHWIVVLALIITSLSPIYVFYLIVKK